MSLSHRGLSKKKKLKKRIREFAGTYFRSNFSECFLLLIQRGLIIHYEALHKVVAYVDIALESEIKYR